ncbi:uncharacterized protein [Rutidosis leptorrhynchoides]|uniref:uncharacterized protein n=1 Tax=Rutidosis leptorrhynchoides TaxID=125765 RepID=UPI003A997B8D
MEKLQRRSQSKDDVPVELIHRIQSLLSVEEAARTCVLSKTWSHAWSTIPHLRFYKPSQFLDEEKQRDHIKFMDRTMSKYVRDNIPIERLDLKLHVRFVNVAYKWLRTLAAARLKELSIVIFYDSDTTRRKRKRNLLPGEIFTGKYLHTLCIIDSRVRSKLVTINCVSLRVLELIFVKISEEVLHTLFSTCTLLENIKLSYCSGLKTIKVRNLRYLQQLKLETTIPIDVLKIDDVPNLCLFDYDVVYEPIKTFNTASLTSVTELSLHGVTIDVAFLDMIKSKLPFLEILKLKIIDWTMERLDITSCSLKRLSLMYFEERQICIKVYAPKLRALCYSGNTIPSLLFPSSSSTTPPEYIKVELYLSNPIDLFFFLRMTDLLNLSSKFDIEIRYHIREPLNMDVNDGEIRWFPIPSTNVQQLSFYTRNQTLIDALLSICRPKYITIFCDSTVMGFSRKFFLLMISRIMANKTCDQKKMEVKNPYNEKWQVVKNSSIPYVDDGNLKLELKPNW